jgi:hypothetical protein
MSKPIMSDAEIKRRKKAQAVSSKATGALGLTALGLTGVAGAKSGAFKRIPTTAAKLKNPKKVMQRAKNASPDQLKNATVPILATSAGIGGVSSFNFAAYTDAEGRKRKMQPVGKAWEPLGTRYNPEEKRRKRINAYDTGTAAGAGVAALAGAGGAIRSLDATGASAELERKAKTAPVENKAKLAAKAAKKTRMARKYNKGALLATGTSGALLSANALIERKKDKAWGTYAKRDSAFGVHHTN